MTYEERADYPLLIPAVVFDSPEFDLVSYLRGTLGLGIWADGTLRTERFTHDGMEIVAVYNDRSLGRG